VAGVMPRRRQERMRQDVWSYRDISQRQAARIAGSAYVVIIVLALFANSSVLDRLREPGDAAATVGNIADSEGLFRSGILALMAVFVADAVVAWALYIFFRRASRDLSLLTAWVQAAVHRHVRNRAAEPCGRRVAGGRC
jgi:hypothetical protein